MPNPQVWQLRGRRPQSPKPSLVSGYPQTCPGVLAHLVLDCEKTAKCWTPERGLSAGWPSHWRSLFQAPLLVYHTCAEKAMLAR